MKVSFIENKKNALNINRDIKFPFKHYSKWDNETWDYIFSTTGIFLETDNKLTLKFKIDKKQPEKKIGAIYFKKYRCNFLR